MRRRSLLASASGGNEGGISFPAVIVDGGTEGNENNAAIAKYILEKYPNIVIDSAGKYTPITEDIAIQTTQWPQCNGTVFGVALHNYRPQAILFYTKEAYPNFWGLRVVYPDDFFHAGMTMEWFYD